MIYFDNAATGGFKPDGVVRAVEASLKNCANAGRSGHKLSLACAERVLACRKLLCKYFGAPSPERVIFTSNCTHALNIALLGGIQNGDEVVTTVAEHNSVLRPLHYLEGKGVKVKYAPLAPSGELDTAALISMTTPQTRAVVVTLASNVTGIGADVATIRGAIPQQTLLICDGAQACGHIKIDLTAWGIDALAVAGHKGMLGIQGSGALILSQRFNPSPITFGGTGSESYNLAMPDFYPDRLESGTLSYPAIISLGEGALYLTSRFYENKDKLLFLTNKLINGLQSIKGVRVYSRLNPFGIVALSIGDLPSERVADILSDEYAICVRGGLHCAPLMHKALGSEGLIRASLSPFNSEREVDYFLRAAEKLAHTK